MPCSQVVALLRVFCRHGGCPSEEFYFAIRGVSKISSAWSEYPTPHDLGCRSMGLVGRRYRGFLYASASTAQWSEIPCIHCGEKLDYFPLCPAGLSLQE